MNLASKYDGIAIYSNQQYSYFQSIFCCKCFQCCKQQTVMTSDIRKETIQRMMEAYLVEDNEKILYDPIKLMILIYICNDDSIPNKYIERCKLNPSVGVLNYRTDLQFYLPQICNYLVFHRNLQNNYLRAAMQKMAKLNFYFAHLYYFYMKGLEKHITKTSIQIIRPVLDYNNKLVFDLRQHYKKTNLTGMDLYTDIDYAPKCEDEFVRRVIIDYETTKMEYGKFTKVMPEDVELKQYYSIFEGKKTLASSFQSTINFFDDLFYICQDLKDHQNKKQKAIEYIKMMNQNLPATAYVPFSKNSYRLCNILKIVTSEVKVFSTKDRAPLCVCIEMYCPSEVLDEKAENIFWTNVEIPITLKMTSFSDRVDYFNRNFQQTAQFKLQRQTSNIKRLSVLAKNIMQEERLTQILQNNFILRETLLQRNSCVRSFDSIQNSPNQDKNSETDNTRDRKKSENNTDKTFGQMKLYNSNTKKFYDQSFAKMFGMPLKQLKKKFSRNSIFGNFKSWDILYIIIKTNDDLKQEQFAMQLIHQFDYIFKLQKLPLILTTYQVLSMGADRGIIQMVRDSVTFDTLKKTLKTQFPTVLTLRDFFQIYYSDNMVAPKQNFVKSLAAYCLVMYIIQVKDRHNGNILLHRNGKIFHIDFGFFLSNMPGGRLELEKNCPFKFLSEYIEVLDGLESSYFKKFRQYFFLGFKAIRKHQNKILMLVKMMYSSSGMTMPCFAKGEAAIAALEKRINPPGIINDSLLNEHCQNLINESLDNWASKWYDRFQYWAQGIFY